MNKLTLISNELRNNSLQVTRVRNTKKDDRYYIFIKATHKGVAVWDM